MDSVNSNKLRQIFLYEEIVKYLDSNGFLKNMKHNIHNYLKAVNKTSRQGDEFNPPFRMVMKIDLLLLQETSGILFDFVFNEPYLFYFYTIDVLFWTLETLDQSSIKFLKKEDLQLSLQVSTLPSFNSLVSNKLLPAFGIRLIYGVLISKSSIIKYIRSSVYICNSDICNMNSGSRSVSKLTNCPYCLSSVKEEIRARDIGDQIICHFINPDAFELSQVNCGQRYQAVTVLIKDELLEENDLELGVRYTITGVRSENVIEAWNIEKYVSDVECLMMSPHLPPVPLPQQLMDIYLQNSETCPDSPWSFVYALSSSLGTEILPVSSFLHLKTGLLLSLASQRGTTCPVPIIAIGADTFACQRLFKIAGRLAERYVEVSSPKIKLGGVSSFDDKSGTIWQECGQIQLSKNGVCNIGDWSKYKLNHGYIMKMLESGDVSLVQKGTNITPSCDKLQSAVWSYWCHVSNKQNDQSQLRSLIEVFGLPFLADEYSELEREKITVKLLDLATVLEQPAGDDKIVHDYRRFLRMINIETLPFADDATRLIKKYFVASRRIRPNCLPITAIKIITGLSEAHARLSLRRQVIVHDVLAVLYLYEQTLQKLYGVSTMCVPYSEEWDQTEHLTVYIDRQIRNFSSWLDNSLKSVVGDFNSSLDLLD